MKSIARSNNFTLSALDTMSAVEIAELPPGVLLDLQRDLEQLCEVAASRADRFRAALDFRFGEQAMQRLRDREEESGKVKILDGEHICEVEVPKTIEWNQTILAELWKRIESVGDDPLVYMSRQLRVSETALNKWPENVQAEFREARSYKNGRKRFVLRKAKTTDAGGK